MECKEIEETTSNENWRRQYDITTKTKQQKESDTQALWVLLAENLQLQSSIKKLTEEIKYLETEIKDLKNTVHRYENSKILKKLEKLKRKQQQERQKLEVESEWEK